MRLEGGKLGPCGAGDRFDAAINRASESGTELGIAATPTFFINGRRLVGVHPVGEFRELIDSELRKSS